MAEITTRVCGVTLESVFKKAVLFRDAQFDAVAQKSLETFGSYGLRPLQIVARSGDQAFNYDLSFSFFSGNATFRISSEKLDISLQNATSDKDLEIVQDCVAKVYEHLPLPEIGHSAVSVNAHATFRSIEEMQRYLSKYANPSMQVVVAGVTAYIRCQNWSEEIRLSIDRSLAYQEGIFLVWSTTYRGNKLSRELLKTLADVLAEAAAKVDLAFSKNVSQ